MQVFLIHVASGFRHPRILAFMLTIDLNASSRGLARRMNYQAISIPPIIRKLLEGLRLTDSLLPKATTIKYVLHTKYKTRKQEYLIPYFVFLLYRDHGVSFNHQTMLSSNFYIPLLRRQDFSPTRPSAKTYAHHPAAGIPST